MNILVCNNGYLRPGVSGGDKHLLDVGEALAREHQVTFILPDFAAPLPAAGIRRLTYRAWAPKSAFGIIAAYVVRAVQASRMAAREGADIILASSGPVDIIPALVNRRRTGARVAVYPFHLVPRRRASCLAKWFQNSVSRLAQRLALRLMRRADVVFTDNPFVADELARHGIPRERIHVQRPVVNVEQVRSAVACPRYQVLFIGRMVRSKGVYDLVEALKAVPVTAGLVGDGEERADLERLVEGSGLGDRVRVLGALPFEEMYPLLKGCELFVFPSNEEGYGIAIAEAIAADKPVLAYELPHYCEVFNDSLVTAPVGDVAGLTARMKDFFAGRIDLATIREKYRGVRLVSKEAAAAFELAVLRAATRG